MSTEAHTQDSTQADTRAGTQAVSRGDRSGPLRTALLVSAAVLAVTVLFRAGGVATPWESEALADMVGETGDFTAMTTRSGAEELLYMVDGRSEQLMVYRVQNGRQVRMMDRQDLRVLFSTAKAAYLGSAPGSGRP